MVGRTDKFLSLSSYGRSDKNKDVYAKFDSELTKAGFIKSGEQFRSKVEKLRQDLVYAYK